MKGHAPPDIGISGGGGGHPRSQGLSGWLYIRGGVKTVQHNNNDISLFWTFGINIRWRVFRTKMFASQT
jgi:hypothetical protein